MPKPVLRGADVESDHKRLDVLIAFVGGVNSEEADLLLEHLHSARIYLLGAMPDEYAASLQSAEEASQQFSNKPLGDALVEALSHLAGRTRDPFRT